MKKNIKIILASSISFVIVAVVTLVLVLTLNHSHTYKSYVVMPTCNSDGYTVHMCEKCDKMYIDNETKALGHDYIITTSAQTCTKKGYTMKICSRCHDELYTDIKPSLGHDYIDTIVPPTCEVAGYTNHKCSLCEDTYSTNFVPAIGHDYVNDICKNCNKSGLDRIVGTLSLISRHTPTANFMQGHTYLAFNATTDVTINVPSLFGMYTMTDEFSSLVAKNPAALSYRYDGAVSDEQHLSIAQSSYNFNTSVSSVSLSSGDFITVGGYNMADNVPYAAMRALLPGANTIDETGILYAGLYMGSYYVLNGEVTEEVFKEGITPFVIYKMKDENANIYVDVIAAGLYLYTEYEKGNLTEDMFFTKLKEIVVKFAGDSNASEIEQIINDYLLGNADAITTWTKLMDVISRIDTSSPELTPADKKKNKALISTVKFAKKLYDLYQLDGNITEDEFVEAVADFFDELVGLTNRQKTIADIRAIIAIYKAYENDNLTPEEIVTKILDVYKAEFGQDSKEYQQVQEVLQALVILYRAYNGEQISEDVLAAQVEILKNAFKLEATEIAASTVRENYINGSVEDLYGGILFNRECYNQKYKYDQFPNEIYSVEITARDLHELEQYWNENSYYSLFTHNCATVACGAWNKAVGYNDDGTKTALYIDSQATGEYSLFDLPMAVCDEILRLKDSVAATNAGGKYIGSRELPMLPYLEIELSSIEEH